MSRLKRKLETAFDGNLPSNLKLNENFCLIGTPLPPLEKSKDTGEFVPLWKQEVRDEKGRRRLHGAFTGGFSAGYFNTVGSKEGWTPATFTSSRSERATARAARPEDFMDDEDLAEMRDSMKLVDTTEEMDLTGGTQAELRKRMGDGPKDEITSALEEALLPATQDSVGARILKKMGWRPGQGVGPRVTWKQLKHQDAQSSTLSSADVASTAAPPEEHEEASKHTYAPRDTKLPVFTRKTNNHGIGYSPGATLHESLATAKASTGPNISAGFGLGALNEAEDDDIDIYDSSIGPSGSRRTAAYDIRDNDDDERPALGPRRPNLANVSAHASSSLSDSSNTFHNGQPVISGFVVSSKKISEDTWFPMPEIPAGWKPDPTRVWKEDKSVDAQPPPPPPRQPGNWKSTISADQRGSMLGETPLPAAPRSVFDYLAPKDRERLRALAAGKPGAVPPPPVPIVIPPLEPRVAQAALKGFQPFAADPAKQARYTQYLQSFASPGDDVPKLAPRPGQSNADLNSEVAGFANAAKIFKPVSGAMASRFTTASVVETGPKAAEGLHRPSETASYLTQPVPEKEREMKLEDPPKVQAAKAGMFGPLTRESEVWFPARLLCKRFGVKDPHPEGAAAEAAAASVLEKKTQFEQETARLAAAASVGAGVGEAPGDEGSTAAVRKPDLSNVGLGEDETQGRDTLTYERPAMDIFKAIFASDGEDSDDDGTPLPAVTAPETAPAPAKPEPAAPKPKAEDDGPVDLATFRPTFTLRTDRKDKDKDKDKKDKKKSSKHKDRSAKHSLVSFEMEEGVEGPQLGPPTDGKEERRKKKKRKEKERPKEEEDDAMWVEADVAPAVKSLDTPAPAADNASAPRGRKRAIDFL
ncbi:DUF1604-domain-containing protein [Auricularia subglabra TFB-10046 SS5]|nr:DUF1604-domain-containing protein [Auricularia subglabra TFB-10046 SS5]